MWKQGEEYKSIKGVQDILIVATNPEHTLCMDDHNHDINNCDINIDYFDIEDNSDIDGLMVYLMIKK